MFVEVDERTLDIVDKLLLSENFTKFLNDEEIDFQAVSFIYQVLGVKSRELREELEREKKGSLIYGNGLRGNLEKGRT